MKRILAITLGVLLLCMLAACNNSTIKSDAKDNGEKQLKEVNVMLDWYPNAVHSFLYAAKEKGYFEEEGVDVNFQFPANPTDPINLAAAGKITLGLTYQPDVILAHANQDVPIKSVGAIVRSPLNHVVFLDESTIKRPKHLEGKTIGYPGTPLNEAIVKTMVTEDGGNPDKVKLVDVGFELESSLVSKKVDAIIGAYINHEVPVLEHKGYKTRYFDPTKHGVPNYYELVAVTSAQTLAKDKDSIDAFWRAAKKGFEHMEKDPDAALELLLTNQDEANFPLVKSVEQQSIEILLPKMRTENGFGLQDQDSWKETSEWMKKTGLIKQVPELTEMYIEE
ncbi:ABC transporter substrate-binding protein [Peribacillus glennii]|uniref:ABC transporter substrate-binding protein n=1 Tax=Peribacillus glennii TaxID=2303991 RepID=A0A372L709_9BACI|nr:ABC transporter substrate-binding protein [Peribacillus glennii]RFU60900.1 ABC transporter substrate-binding protein [Peribacillus glennii]